MKKTVLVSFILTLCMILLDMSGCSGGSSESSPPPSDTTAPTVLSTSPAAGATAVAANAAITVTFSEAMDPATINTTTFTLKDSGGHATSGTVVCNGTTATFTPSSLSYLTTYTATVTKEAKDVAGNALAAEHTWTFTVVTTPSPLLSRQTLKTWIDNGQVNGTGTNRVVVLDVNSASTYNGGHIPGALLFDPNDATAPLYQTRREGPAFDVNMVPDGQHMDAIVHKYGIDDHATVVFTASNPMNATRAYWTFRYWGFAKDKLKVLDGFNASWNTQYGLTTAAPPSIAPSTYSVKSNGAPRTELRASLSEMIEVVSTSPANAIVLDARTASTSGSYAGTAGSTQGVFASFDPVTATTINDFVAFEGHMKGAKALNYMTLYNTTTLEFKDPQFLTTTFATVGIDSTKTSYVHCRTGVIASVPFFVLDAILNWHAVDYDGSWSQWGQLSMDSTRGGQLTSDKWRTDISTLSEVFNYNHDAGKPVELLSLDGRDCTATFDADGMSIAYTPGGCTWTAPESDAASGNQIEEEDELYLTQ